MKIVLLGANGQVGWELRKSLSSLKNVIAFDRSHVDLEDIESLKKRLLEIKPEIIVNAAAYTQVDKAESEPEKAYLINSTAVNALAEVSKNIGVTLIHYSTDYVFDGTKEGYYLESDPTAPLNVYGKSKLEGEKAILASGCNYFIFRTSWVYGWHGNNFIKTILRLAQEKEGLKIINDQFGAPTSAEFIATLTTSVIHKIKGKPELNGIYNLVPSGETTWYEFAKLIVECALESGLSLKTDPTSIESISSENYHTPAARPKNSRLGTTKLQSTFDMSLPKWEEGVYKTVSRIIQP